MGKVSLTNATTLSSMIVITTFQAALLLVHTGFAADADTDVDTDADDDADADVDDDADFYEDADVDADADVGSDGDLNKGQGDRESRAVEAEREKGISVLVC